MNSKDFQRGPRQWCGTQRRIERTAARIRKSHRRACTSNKVTKFCTENHTFRTAYISWSLGSFLFWKGFYVPGFLECRSERRAQIIDCYPSAALAFDGKCQIRTEFLADTDCFP